jgi:two-component system chemotaxis response regulator CheY
MDVGRNILLIEDDDGIRDSVAECLSSEGYSVTPVSNGVEGLEWLRRSNHADLIVLDLVMPVMNGAQFLAAVREDPVFRQVPVVLMTAAMPTGDMPIPQANGYLEKPFELDDLLATVARHTA